MKKRVLYPAAIILLVLTTIQACITPKRGPRRALAEVEQQNRSFDAIIVPGIPFDIMNNGWDSVMKARVIWSWVLYKNGIAKNIIYSGGAVYTPFVESYVMGIYGKALGIPAKNIFYDTVARHSTENVYYSYLLAKDLGFKSVALATDPFQSGVLKSFLRTRFGTPVYALPFVTDSLAAYNHLHPRVDPTAAMVDDFTSIKQENFFERFKGTIGRDIDWHKYENGKLPSL